MAIVLINISRWVKGCADLPSGDDRLWRWVSADPVDILERTARLAGVAITGLTVKNHAPETDICARIAGHSQPVTIVTVCRGDLSFRDLDAALDTLIKEERKAAA